MKTYGTILCASAIALVVVPAVQADDAPQAETPTPAAREAGDKRTTEPLSWGDDLAAARRRAQIDKRPIFVRAGAPWCTWCNRLQTELESSQVRPQLERFVLVEINVDEDVAASRGLAVGAIPALRVLDVRGRVVASRDGFISAEQISKWLAESFDAAVTPVDDVLTDSRAPDTDVVAKLVEQLGRQDPLKREAALRRLAAHPAESAVPIAAAFRQGKLATRLAVLEVLTAWHAPIDELDPWRPETLAPDRLAALEEWARTQGASAAQPTAELSDDQRAAAERDLARLGEADDVEADAIRERLSRYGAAVAPLVSARLPTVTTDRERERLQMLQYRLVASAALVLSWPGGLERLASVQAKTRHDAIAELAGRATADDERLLLELFKDPDPLVREISLRGLQAAGGAKSSGSLATLLNDPAPNVRAAVLKQLGEEPAPGLIPTIIAYAEREQDPDLVIHAVRVLKATSNPAAMECVMNLLKHDSWQVRAEAAEAVGELAGKTYGDAERQADAYVALIGLLDDADPFVISRALQGLHHSDLAVAVEPLAKIVDKHPDLAATAVKALVEGETMRRKSLPHLRKYAIHQNPAVRAAAIPGLVSAEADPADNRIVPALSDPASIVRQAAAGALWGMFSAARAQHTEPSVRSPAVNGGLVAAIGSLFQGLTKSAAAASDAADADAWLVDYRAGKGRPDWMNGAIEPLEKMLSANDRPERLIAALALVPLGRDERALTVLKETAQTAPETQGEIGGALAWLPYAQRREFFQFLIALHPQSEQMAGIVRGLVSASDARDAELLWGLLATAEIESGTAATLQRGLWTSYGIDRYLRPSGMSTPTPPADTVALMRRYAEQGTGWQRTAALSILLALDPSATAEAAQIVLDDPQAVDEFRCDALQILLLANPGEDAEKAAVKQLSSAGPRLRKLAIGFLCHGGENLRQLRGHGIYLQSARDYGMHFSSEPEPIAAPQGLTADMVRPWLQDPDPDVAADVAYLLATLGEPDGLKILIDRWRNDRTGPYRVPVYRAIAVLDKESEVPILAEIYSGLESHEMRQFYWTLRTMHGPEILKLRKRIREEVGMDNLR